MSKQLKRRLGLGVGLAFLVLVGLLFYGDLRQISRLLQEFQWALIPAIFGLTVVNYALRGIRFHYYLRQVGVLDISLWMSLRVFIGGFSLTLTPGKLGELIRVYWLKNIAGAKPARVAPTIIVDRIVDGLAMAILAVLGILAYPNLWPVVAGILTMLILVVVIIQIRPLALWFLSLGEKVPFVQRIAHHLYMLYESSYELLRPKNFMIGLLVGLVAWTAEGVAFYLILIGLGVPESIELLFLSVATLAVGSVLGGISSLPGGLGATEISMTGILQGVVGISAGIAATAVLMIRFFTLWSGVGLGILVVIIWRRTLFGSSDVAQITDQQIESELKYGQTS